MKRYTVSNSERSWETNVGRDAHRFGIQLSRNGDRTIARERHNGVVGTYVNGKAVKVK